MKDYQAHKAYETNLASTELGRAFLNFERLSDNAWAEDNKIDSMVNDPKPQILKNAQDLLAQASAARKILTDLILLKG